MLMFVAARSTHQICENEARQTGGH